MNMTLESDYAIRILCCLAKNGRRMDAGQIAEETGVTLRFSLKILRKLVSGGLICSFKGTRGGYEMGRAPGEITLRQVLAITEGDYSLNRCAAEDFVCTRGMDGACRTRQVFEEISRMVNDKLEAVCVSDLL